MLESLGLNDLGLTLFKIEVKHYEKEARPEESGHCAPRRIENAAAGPDQEAVGGRDRGNWR